MSLFNFQDNSDEFNNEFENQECNCEKCSQLAVVELVANYTDIILQANNEEELIETVYDLVNIAKIYGVKEYLYNTINAQSDVLEALNSINFIYDEDEDDFYGTNGNWINRLK